jgi:hypothetical protein
VPDPAYFGALVELGGLLLLEAAVVVGVLLAIRAHRRHS